MRVRNVKTLLLLAAVMLAGCGYSEAELEGAYRDGHRAVIIWCKRLGGPPQLDLDEELLLRWREGFIESTSLQCASEARKLEF